MKIDIRNRKIKGIFIAQLFALAALCFSLFVVSISFKDNSQAVAEPSATYMNMETGELSFNSNINGRSSSGNAQMYADGTFVESFAAPVMTVWHFPSVAEVRLNTTIRKQYTQGTAELYFRIVHEHARTGLNEVIYPADGTWLYLNDELNAEGTGYNTVSVNEYVNVLAGDKIKIIVRNANNGGWCTAVLGGGIYFLYDGGPASGVSINYTDTSVSYVSSDTAGAAIPEALREYYGANAVKSDVITYEYITSYTDHNDGNAVPSDTFLNYDVQVIQQSVATVQGDNFTAKQQSFIWGPDLSGAEYISFDVNNTLGDAAGVGFEILISDDNVYGAVWTAGAYTEYYAISGNVITVGKLTAGEFNRGEALIPAGFNGTIIFPIVNLEKIGYRFGSELNGAIGDFKIADLGNIWRFDTVVNPVSGASYSASGTLSVSNLKILGTELPETEASEDRAIRAIKNIGEVNLASERIIAYARSVYNSLPMEKQLLVSNYGTLTAAESRFATLTDYSAYIGTHGKDFKNSEGVVFGKTFSSPSTVAAWIKVARDIADNEHIGTVIGNLGKTSHGQGVYDSDDSFSMEITSNGNPRFTWRVSETEKATFVVKNVDVRINKWIHLAFTRDARSNLITCYVNGVVAAQKYVDDGDIADIKMKVPAMIGSDYTDDFVLSINEDPKFKGYIANARVYSDVLNASAIISDAKGVKSGRILGCVDFLSGEAGEYYEQAGIGAFDAYGWQDVQSEDLHVEDGFTLAVFGNTQMMLAKAKDGQGRDLYDENYDYTYNVFYKNVQWLIDNKDGLNLEFVMHMGNLTDNLNNSFAATKGVKELEYGMSFMDMLTTAGVRWSLNRGNHDGGFDSTHTGLYDAGYSYANYAALADGTYNNSDMHSAYYTFETGGRKYLIISLDLEPTDAELNWANSVISANADRRVIITTHAYIGADGKLINNTLGGLQNNNGAAVWEKCASKHKNVIMVLCGHANGVDVVKSEKVGDNGNTVYQVMIDESRMEYFGSRQTGVFALLNFAENGNRINVSYYSATESRLFRTCNQFSIDLNSADYDFELEKDELQTVLLPDINAFGGANGRTDMWGGMYVYADGDSNLGMNSNNFGINDLSYGYAAAFDITASGVFRFDETAYVKTNASSWFYLSAFVVSSDGTAKRWFPKDANVYVPSASETQGITLRANSVEYVIKGDGQQFPLSDLGALSVNAGDKVIVFMQSFGVNYAKFEAVLYTGSGTTVNYSTGNAFNTASTAASAIITELFNAGYGATLNGAPVNYNGITVGWYRTDDTGSTYAPFKYSLTVSDTDDNVIISAVSVKNATYELPTLERLGKVFIGYEIDGDIYPAGYVLTIDKDITATAVFAGFYMVNGASVRLKDPSGLRFSAHITESDYVYLIGKGLNIQLGTVIVKAADITSDGKINYDLITTDTEIMNVNVVSTVQKTEYGNLTFNLALVGISAGGYSDRFAARSYMIITYADGTEKTLYASVGDNARSVAEVARAALDDVSLIYSERYAFARNGAFSPYSAQAAQTLNGFAQGV